MDKQRNDPLRNYADQPFGVFRVTNVKIGRIHVAEISGDGPEAALAARAFFDDLCERTRRKRLGKGHTRNLEPLPVAYPARRLSVEMQDYLADKERRNFRRQSIETSERTLKLLLLTCGDIPASMVNYKHIYRLWDLLRWWAPMIGLHTGMRINEVAQLKVNDIVEEDGLWCIAIRKTCQRQSLKGKAAVRTLPIPQALLDAGFLDFLADIQACGHPRLFPHLAAGVNRKTGQTHAKYSQGLLDQLSDYMAGLGIPKGIRFHTFRHTFATRLSKLGVSEKDIAVVTGHTTSRDAVPTLRKNYIHVGERAALRALQRSVVDRYQPPVQLPVYRRGQFAKLLEQRWRFKP